MTIMVIAGAGASYDSIPSRLPKSPDLHDDRPPLGDFLFAARPMYEEVQRQVPHVMQIVPVLQARARGESVEDVLARFASEISSYPHREIQLASARYYIQSIIAQTEELWYRERTVPTNMMVLLDQIEAARGNRTRPVFATFNYDRLIEHALENRGQRFRHLGDYVREDSINVFKLYGSVNWAREVGAYDSSRHGGTSWEIARFLCDNAAAFRPRGPFILSNDVPSARVQQSLAVPAIAIPLKEKTGFECPDDHIDRLKEQLRRVRVILTIGWRGAEQHFLKFLGEHALQGIHGICVTGDARDAAVTANALSNALTHAHFEPVGGGFSQFVASGGVARLLNLAWQFEK